MKKLITQQYQLLNTWLQLRKTTLPGNIKKDVFRIFKDCYKLIEKKNNGEITCQIGNYKMRSPDPTVLQLLLREIMINETYLINLDNKEPLIIDCGSNIGFSILYFKIKYPNAQIIGIEANPDTFKILQENVKQFEKVTLYNNFVSNVSNSHADLYTYGAGDVSASHNTERGGGNKNIVETISLKDLVADKKIDLLKMDIEGGEIFIFNSQENTAYLDHVKNILLEYHHMFENGHPLNSLSDFLSVFEKNDFIYNLITEKIQRPFPYFQDIFFIMKSKKF